MPSVSSKTAAPAKKKARGRAKPAATAVVPAELLAERKRVMEILKPVVELMGKVMGPNIELVLHDLTQPNASVVAIANGHVTGRAVGSPILSGPQDDVAFRTAFSMTTEVSTSGCEVVGIYPSISQSGTTLKSATAIYRDASGTPFAGLCINADMSMMKLARDWLDRLIDGPLGAQAVTPSAVAPADMDVLIAQIIDTAVKTTGKPVALMSKDEKIQAVEQMLRRGLFVVKGSVPRAAKELNLSRHTIYNYLAQIKAR